MSEHQHAREDTVQPAVPLPVPRRKNARDAFLYAREVLEADRPELVFPALDPIADGLRNDERTEAAVLCGTALVALGRLDDGIALLRPAVGSGCERLRTEAACELARAYLRAGRLDDAETTLAPFLDRAGAGEPQLAAGGLALYGRIERARGRRAVAARYFLDALAVLERAREPFHVLRNALLHDVAAAAVETLEPRLFARVRGQIRAVDRTHPEYAALQRVRVLGELLCGDMVSAWEIAFASTHSNGGGLRYVTGLFGVAAVSHAAGDTFSATRLALAAAEAAAFVDWGRGDTGDRQALLRFVAALAPVDANRATALLRLYEALPPLALGAGAESAVHGLARAALFGARGDSAQQRAALERAADAARDDGDHYGEVQALLETAAADGDERALARADELTRLVPRSWLRRRYDALVQNEKSGIAQLSPAQRRVMLAICEGLSTADIAARFGRAKNTIRNQTRHVFEAMDVRSRSALVAKCATLGLLAPASPYATQRPRPS